VERRDGQSRPASRSLSPLGTDFYARPAEVVAPALLGQILVSESADGCVSGLIVETEAYTGPDDPACHAAERIGRTERNDPLYGAPGTAYIHMNYGVHWCLNAVTDREGYPAAVLIRALEPLAGEAIMRSRRGREELTNGPARLTQALGVGPQHQRHFLGESPLWIGAGAEVDGESIVVTSRVGITRARERKLRFYVKESEWVSRR
jgi:DNA-3-methyladenine glycosylase